MSSVITQIPRILIALLVAALASGPDAQSDGRTPCERLHPSDERVEWTCRTMGPKESLESLYGDLWIDVARFNRIDRRHVVPGTRIKAPKRPQDVERFSPMPTRYASADSDSQFVLVDLSEQFLGAYEHGRLVFSAPIASGKTTNPTPTGTFRITAYDRSHESSIYDIVDTNRPYPMHYGLRFFVTASGMAYWIHGRDLPGVPASHGCIGLYDEEMQRDYYGRPQVLVLADARRLFQWVVGSRADTIGTFAIRDGPRVRVVESTVVLDTVSLTQSLP